MFLKCFTTLVIIATIRSSYSEIFCPNEEIMQIGQNTQCSRGLNKQPVSCLEPILPNTTAVIDCKYNYKVSYESRNGRRSIICQPNGEWSGKAFKCEGKCAGTILTTLSVEQIWDNRYDKITKSPWTVAIYKVENNNDKYDPISTYPRCGGVLLNEKLVLSHAGCLKKFNLKDLSVLAGKYDGRTTWPEPFYQFSTIKEVYVNDKYVMVEYLKVLFYPIGSGIYGDTRLAIVELENYFIYSRVVRPACIEWDLLSNKSQSLDEVGLLPVWGHINDCVIVRSRKELNTLELKNFTDSSGCTELKENLAEGQIAEKYPQDTFCYKYDSIVYINSIPEIEKHDCHGLSGSGMFMAKSYENETNKNSLWAIVHNREKLSLNNSNIRYVKSFIQLLPQKDFILHYLEKFSFEKLLSEEYLQKPCILDFRENVFKTSDVTCHLGNEVIPCQQETKPETIVRSKCRFGYSRTIEDGPDVNTCARGGRWSNELVDCTKICGQLFPKGTFGLLFGGNVTDIDNVPWHVGIYANNIANSNGRFIQICGGTIVHSNIIITAAHCFWNSNSNQANEKNKYVVVAGKRYRDYDSPEKQRVQYSKIKDLVIPRTYNVLFYRHDIAIVVLEKPFQFNSFTKPACLTLLQFGNYDIGGNVKGLVSGWGATSQFGDSSNELRSVEILTLTNENCKDLVDFNSRDEVTGEKFCAQGKEGETACRGDSGGGFLVPQIEEDGIRRYYLWGVVSSGLDSRQHCTAKFFSTYTNVQYHQDIINVVISNNTL